jgi:hypothetical protein
MSDDTQVDDDLPPPVTPLMVQEQLARISLAVRIEDMAEWNEPLCEAAFNWGVDVEIAWMDGGSISIEERPPELTAALDKAGNWGADAQD